MTQHKRNHSKPRTHSQGEGGESEARKFHKDWRVWLAVGMMLAAIFTYVLTLDDSVVPSIMRQ